MIERIGALSLHDLKTLLVLSEVLHFGRASEILGVSQPSISQTVKKAENLVGTKLFDRSSRGCFLTQDGAQVVERIREAMSALQEIASLKHEVELGSSVSVAVGMIPTMAHLMISRLLSPLLGSDLGLEVTLTEATTDQLIELVLNRTLDCALVSLPIDHAAMKVEVLLKEELVLAVSEPEGSCFGEIVVPDEIPNDRMILLDGGHCLRRQALDICPGAPLKGTAGHTLQVSTLLELVGMGVGVTILPASLESSRMIESDIQLLPIQDPVPQRAVAVMALKSRWEERPLRRFRTAIAMSCNLAQSEVPYLHSP